MTEEEALLAAIRANKEDDTPRLMFADWLTENGQPYRAEFIRVQVKLARHTKYIHGIECHDVEVVDLLRRERELLTIYRAALGDLPRGPFLISVRNELVGQQSPFFCYGPSRGFVSVLTCSWQDWIAHADAIRAAHPVERVKLTTRPDARVRFNSLRAWKKPVAVGADAMWSIEAEWPGIEFELPPEVEPARPLFLPSVTPRPHRSRR